MSKVYICQNLHLQQTKKKRNSLNKERKKYNTQTKKEIHKQTKKYNKETKKKIKHAQVQ